MKDNSSRLTIMVKPTNACDLRCKYCYHASSNYYESTMELGTLKNVIESALGCYSELHIIWHGGEPLLVGSEFYSNVVKIENDYLESIRIVNSVQTNGTHLDENFINTLLSLNFRIGFSFDGVNNEITRGKSEATIIAMNSVKKKIGNLGAIKVVVSEDIQNNGIVESYYLFKEYGFSMKLKPVFNCELTSQETILSPEAYANAIIDLYTIWKEDIDCNIRVDPIEAYFSLITGGRRICDNSSCLSRYICIDPVGDIFPCARFYGLEYRMGNINSINKISEAFDTDAFKLLLRGAIERRKQCLSECQFFDMCQGGCNHDAINEGELKRNGFFSCQVFKILYPFFYNELIYANTEDIRNPRMHKYL